MSQIHTNWWMVLLGTTLLLKVLSSGASVYEKTGARTECGKGNRQFKKQHVYYYQYEGTIASGIRGITDDLAILQVSARLSFRYKAGCTYVMKIHNVKFGEKLGNTSRESEKESTEWLASGLQKYPLLFTLDQGLVLDIRPELRERNKIILNIKRSILSVFQLKWSKVRNGIETDISGNCRVTYHKTRSGQVRTIVKKKVISTCTQRSLVHSVIEAVEYAQGVPWYDASSQCQHRLRKKNEIEFVECLEKFKLRPFSSGAESGGFVESRQKIQLMRVRRNKGSDTYEDFYVSSLHYEHEHLDELPTKKAWNTRKSHAEDVIKRLASQSANMIQPDAAKLFANLVVSLRYLTESDLEALVGGSQRCLGLRDCDMELRLSFESFLFDALAQCGSTPCVRVLSGIIVQGRLPVKAMRQLVASMAFIQEPTMEMVNVIMYLHQKVQDPSILSLLGTVMHKLCQHRRDDCERNGPIRDLVRVAEYYLLRLLGNDCTVQSSEKANPILYALKAIGNAGRPLHARALIIDCARNAPHLNVSVAALQALRRMSVDSDFKDFLYEMVTDKNADTERRMEAFFLLMGNANEDDALLIIDMINDDKDAGQLRSLLHSYVQNIISSRDPSKTRLKQDFLNALRTRNLTNFDLTASKFSKYKSWSFHMDNVQIGATAESVMFFHPESFIPRTVRLNLTSNVFGNAINVLGIDLRTEGLEMLAGKFLSPGGYFSSSHLESIFSIPDELPRRSSFKERVRQARSTGEEAFLMGRLRDLHNHVNLKRPFPQMSLALKVFGSEIQVLTLDDLPVLNGALDTMNIVEHLYSLSQGTSTSLQRNLFFLESEFVLPTIVGFPLKLHANGSAVVKLGVEGSVQIKNIFFGPKVLSMKGSITPSLAVELSARMTVDGFYSQIGVHVNSSVYSSSSLGGKFTYTEDSEFDVDLDVQQNPIQLFNVTQNIFHVIGNSEISIKGSQKEGKAQLCTNDVMEATELIGLDLCGEVSFPIAFQRTDAPFFPLTGPSSAGLVIVPRDPLLSKYSIVIKNVDGVYKVNISTPEATFRREYTMEVGVSIAASEGVIGATFGKFRKGIMLRYQYDNFTHSVKAQLQSNLTSNGVTLSGHYFNKTDPVTLEKRLGYEARIQSKGLDVYNTLRFEDTYQFWAAELLTIYTNGEKTKLRFQVQYDPQVISILLKNTASHTSFILAVKPGFPTTSSHLNVTHGHNFALNASGMIDLKKLVGEGEVSVSPSKDYLRGRFKWIDTSVTKGFSMRTEWRGNVTTLSALFRLDGKQRVFTSDLHINKMSYNTVFQFNKTHLDLGMKLNGYPVQFVTGIDNKANQKKIRLALKLPTFNGHLSAGFRDRASGHNVCLDLNVYQTNYSTCFTSEYSILGRKASLVFAIPEVITRLYLKQETLQESLNNVFGIDISKYFNLTVKATDEEDRKLMNWNLLLPLLNTRFNAKSIATAKGIREAIFEVDTIQAESVNALGLSMKARRISDHIKQMSNSSFSVTSDDIGDVVADFWSVPTMDAIIRRKKPIVKFGGSLSLLKKTMQFSYSGSSINAAIKCDNSRSKIDINLSPSLLLIIAKTMNHTFNVQYSSKGALINMSTVKDVRKSAMIEVAFAPIALVRITTFRGRNVKNVTEIKLRPMRDKGYSVLIVRHPSIAMLQAKSPSFVKALKNKIVSKVESLLLRYDEKLTALTSLDRKELEKRFQNLLGKEADPRVAQKLADVAAKFHSLMKKRMTAGRSHLWQEIGSIVEHMHLVPLTTTKSHDLKAVLTKLQGNSQRAKSDMDVFMQELLTIVLKVPSEFSSTVLQVKGKQMLISSINASLSDLFATLQISNDIRPIISSAVNSLISGLFPNLITKAPSEAIEGLLNSMFKLIRFPNLETFAGSEVTKIVSVLEKYIPGLSKHQPKLQAHIIKKVTKVVKIVVHGVSNGRNVSIVADEVVTALRSDTSKILHDIFAARLTQDGMPIFGKNILKFVTDLDFTSLVKSSLRRFLTAAKFSGDHEAIIDTLLKSKGMFEPVKRFSNAIIHHSDAPDDLKKVFQSFLSRQDIRRLVSGLLSYSLGINKVDPEITVKLLDIVESRNATVMTRRLMAFILERSPIPQKYNPVISSLVSGDVESGLRNLTHVLLLKIANAYEKLYPDGVFHFLRNGDKIPVAIIDFLRNSSFASYFSAVEANLDTLLKDKDIYNFARSSLSSLLKGALVVSSEGSSNLPVLIKKAIVKKLYELSSFLLDLVPEEMQAEAEVFSTQFINVLKNTPFQIARRNVTQLVRDLLKGWTQVLSTSEAVGSYLDKASEISKDLGYMIAIGNASLAEWYDKILSEVEQRIHLAAKVLAQFSPEKYGIFLEKYVTNGNIEFYKMYKDFLSVDFTGDVYKGVDQLIDALGARALQEIQSQTGNYDLGVLIRNVIDSVMRLNYSDVNDVLKDYRTIDYNKYANFSLAAVKKNLYQFFMRTDKIRKTQNATIGDPWKKSLGEKLLYTQRMASTVFDKMLGSMKMQERFLELSRTNASHLMKMFVFKLQKDYKTNPRLKNIIETLILPASGALIKLVGESRVGNKTFADLWMEILDKLPDRQGLSEGQINELWYITERFAELQDTNSILTALEIVARLVDAVFRLGIEGQRNDQAAFRGFFGLVNSSLHFAGHFLVDNAELPIIHFISKAITEGQRFLVTELHKYKYLLMYLPKDQRDFLNSLFEKDYTAKFANSTTSAYKHVGSMVNGLVSMKSLKQLVPSIIQNASKIARDVIKGCLRFMDQARSFARNVSFLRDPKAFFEFTYTNQIKKALKSWSKIEPSVFAKLNSIEEAVRGRLRSLDIRSQQLKQLLEQSLLGSDLLVGNFTHLLLGKFAAFKKYVNDMRAQFLTLSEQYVYRLLLNTDLLVKRLAEEVSKIYQGRQHWKKLSLLEMTNGVSSGLKTWRENSHASLKKFLRVFFSRLTSQYRTYNQYSRLIENIKSEVQRNTTKYFETLRKVDIQRLKATLDSVSGISSDYMMAFFNGTKTSAWKSAIREIWSRWKFENGTASMILPWIPDLQGFEKETVLETLLKSLNTRPFAMQQKTTLGRALSSYNRWSEQKAMLLSNLPSIDTIAEKVDIFQKQYAGTLIKATQEFSKLADRYGHIVERITLNATAYVLQMYETRFLLPFKRITDQANIVAPVDSVPPMPSLPGAWNKITAMFQPIKRTAVLYGRHVFTFDGRYVYTAVPSRFRVGCTYVLARDFGRGNFTLLLEGEKLIVESFDSKIVFKKGAKVEAYERVGFSDTGFIGPFSDVPYETETLLLTKHGSIYSVTSDYGFEVNCNVDFMWCNFTVSGFYHNQTLGIFGTNNEEYSDDYRLPGGRIATDMMEFLNEWELTQKDKCHLQNQDELLPACRRLPSRRCRELFKDLRSPLARGFANLNPKPFLTACELETSKCSSHSRSRNSVCPITSTYVQIALSLGAKVAYPEECVTCFNVKGYGNRPPTNQIRRKLKEVDIVLLIKETENMDAFMPNLHKTLKKIDRQLQISRMNVRFQVVGFDGSDSRLRPHLQTGNTLDSMVFSDLEDAFTRLEFEGDDQNPNREGLSALRFAAGLPFRPMATKIFLLVENDATYSGRLQEMMETNSLLVREGIILNVINNYRLKKGVIGKSSSGKRYHIKVPKGEQLRTVTFPPADDYVPIVKETKGSVLTLKGLASTNDKWLKAYPMSLSSILYHQIIADLRLCKVCACEQNNLGFGTMKCSKVDPVACRT